MKAHPDFRDVIVADDDRICRMHIRRTLEKAGYAVAEAEDGAEALRLAVTKTPSFLITDWSMPVLNGLDLCREVRKAPLPNYVFAILLTSREGTESFVTALASGADEFVTKPVAPEALLARLNAGTRILQLERRLQEQATRDFLTGALNRRAFFSALEREMARSRRTGSTLSCAIVDADRFKAINDVRGHQAGDEALRELYRRIEACSRGSDVVARYGGEEFCVLLPDCSESLAGQWAERCRARIADDPFILNGEAAQVTASFGVAGLPGHSSAESLLAAADAALYEAKRTGKNRVAMAGSSTAPELAPA